MIRKLYLSVIFVLASASLFAQKPADEGRVVRYVKDVGGGFILHGEGWGGYFRYGKFLTYNKRIQFSLDVVSMHHSKEVKIFNPNIDDGKGYYYGKLNSLYIIRPAIGLRRIYFEKLREKGVEISINYSVGPSLGLVKPVYLQILHPTNDPLLFNVTDEKYDPSQHTIDNIYGRSKGGRGFGESKFNPGAFAKIGFQFEYANEDDAIRALEVGAITDFYFKPVELMAQNPSQNLFLSLYFKIIFGRKYF